MQFFIDTADVGEIKKALEMGLCDGVTTNPSLVAKTGRRFDEVLREIVALKPGPISAEVTAVDCEGMLREAEELVKFGPDIVIKIPLITEGLRAVKTLTAEGVKTNVTLCFSAVQALLAAKAGAT
ncbi:MAG TPA: transaldolase family protein, partial [Anaeromyxobacteraceae bacterium]|nr:transaldolase family protein [Anaeromyxobacteraceae bacterium]